MTKDRYAMLESQANSRARAADSTIHGPVGGGAALDGEAALCAIFGWKPLTEAQKAECEKQRAEQDAQMRRDTIESLYRHCGVLRRHYKVELKEIAESGLPQMIDAAGKTVGKKDVDAFIDAVVQGKTGQSMWFCGRPGTGKTTLACAILHEIIRRGGSGKYYKVPDIMTRMDDARTRASKETRKGIIDEVGGSEFLVLDEIARCQTQEGEKNMLFQVIDHIYDTFHSGIYITNLSREELSQYLGSAASDRFRGQGMSVEFNGREFRGTQGELFTIPE